VAVAVGAVEPPSFDDRCEAKTLGWVGGEESNTAWRARRVIGAGDR
jgi:hypothetical protein